VVGVGELRYELLDLLELYVHRLAVRSLQITAAGGDGVELEGSLPYGAHLLEEPEEVPAGVGDDVAAYRLAQRSYSVDVWSARLWTAAGPPVRIGRPAGPGCGRGHRGAGHGAAGRTPAP
jgi:hypothetical protein